MATGRTEPGPAWVTLPMLCLALQQRHLLCQEAHLRPGDTIEAVRLGSPEGERQIHVLYVELTQAPTPTTQASTVQGSRFLLDCDLSTALNALLDALGLYMRWAERLQGAMGRGCTLQELIDLSDCVLHRPLFILDANAWVLASSRAFSEEFVDHDWYAIAQRGDTPCVEISEYAARYAAFSGERLPYTIPGSMFAQPAVAMNLFVRDSFAGRLVMIAYPEPLDSGEQDTLQVLCQIVQGFVSEERSSDFFDRHERPLAQFLSQGDLQPLRTYLQQLLWREEDEKLVLCAAPAAAGHLALDFATARVLLARLPGVIATVYAQRLVLLCNVRLAPPGREMLDLLRERLLELSYLAGCSTRFASLEGLLAAVDQATVALSQASPEAGAMMRFEACVLPYLLRVLRKQAPETLRHPSLEKLALYDRSHGSALLETLFCLLRNERRIADTAREMQISRSTLNHRIEHLQELLGEDLDRPEMRLHMLLSLYSRELNNNLNNN